MRSFRNLSGHWTAWAALLLAPVAPAQVPENLVAESIPPIPAELRQSVSRYLEFRSAAFSDWHPTRREMLISTRFADAAQLHLVRQPGGARRQLTFFPEPVARGLFQPRGGESLVFAQDTGGGEFYQLHRFDLADARVTLLTDGKARNTGPRWSRSGRWLAYTSTRRNGTDNDIYVIDPAAPQTDRRVMEAPGGGWAVADWSHDETRLLLLQYVSINESYLHLCDLGTGARTLITPATSNKVAYGQAAFARDDRTCFATTDKDSEYQHLMEIDLPTGRHFPVSQPLPWDVVDFDLSPDGRLLAFVTNEDGASVLHLLSVKTGKALRPPPLPTGVIAELKWHPNSRELAFNLTSARSPNDVYSFDTKSHKLDRWTESETGGLNPARFVEPQLVKLQSFDRLAVSGFLYRPDPARFPGPRPVLINIHGGPEGQSQPIFQARNNYFLDELGIALLYPNVRGSAGRGKTFLTLDNGFQREDAVKDIGCFIDWLRTQPGIAADRIGVIGGSYGGYMVLASMVHYADKLRCGVDVVGISNFLTFLKNTQDYRRDLRRVEYGDERDPAMAAFLEKISPLNQASRITKPLFVVQGQNDPRVPVTEAEQMVKAIRDQGGAVWYLKAKDEGHGFQKKKNADFQFLATILFLRQHLL